MLRKARRLAALHRLHNTYARGLSLANGGCLIMLWSERCLVPLHDCVVTLCKARRLVTQAEYLFMPLYSKHGQL